LASWRSYSAIWFADGVERRVAALQWAAVGSPTMIYRKLKNGTHAVGFTYQGQFLAYATAFDAREAKALSKAIHAVIELFHATSGAWITIGPEGKVMPRGSSAKAAKKKRAKSSS
jgi:hypothetical protein